MMETNPEKALGNQQNHYFRKGASAVFLGMIFYLLLQFLLQNAFVVVYLLVSGAPVEREDFSVILQNNTNGLGWGTVFSVLCGCLLLWLYFSQRKIRAAAFPEQTEAQAIFGREKRIDLKVFLLCVCLLFFLQLLFTLIFSGFEQIFNHFGLTLAGSEAVETDYSVTASLLIYAILAGPFAEEMVFRGFVMKGLKQYGRIFAIVLSAFCFALMHGDFQQSMFTFFAGLIFGFLAMEYSLFWSFLLHAFNNYVLGELWGRWIGQYSQSSQDWIAYSLIGLTFLILLLAFFRRKTDIRAWFARYQTPAGTARKIWCSPLLILFTLFYLYRIVCSINPQ